MVMLQRASVTSRYDPRIKQVHAGVGKGHGYNVTATRVAS